MMGWRVCAYKKSSQILFVPLCNTLDLESDNRMDSTGYVQYAISEAKAYAAIAIAEEGMRQKAIEAFKFAVDGYFIIGGTDYSADRLNEFIKKLES